MIKVNLLGDVDTSYNNYSLNCIYYFSSVIILIVGLFVVNSSGNSNLNKLTLKKENLEKEVMKLKEITKKTKEFELKKGELAEKLVVIATLKKSKMGPVHVLDDLNKAMPERSWLTEVRESGGVMTLAGIALDNQTIASFMQTLENSKYFNSVDLEEAKQDERQGVKVKVFTLKSKINYTGIEALQSKDVLDKTNEEKNKIT